MRSWISATRSLAGHVTMAKLCIQSEVPGRFQLSQMAAKGEWLAASHANGKGLLDRGAPNRFPFEEAVDRQQTPPASVGVAKRRQRGDGLRLGVDRFACAAVVLAPVGYETPPQSVQAARASFGVLADHPVLLARRSVVARRRVASIEGLDQRGNLEPEDVGIGFLRNASTRGLDVSWRPWQDNPCRLGFKTCVCGANQSSQVEPSRLAPAAWRRGQDCPRPGLPSGQTVEPLW